MSAPPSRRLHFDIKILAVELYCQESLCRDIIRSMTEDAINRIVHEWNRERPDLDVSVTHVLQRVTRLYLLQSASFAEVFDRYGLPFGEYEVLAALVRSGPPHRLKPSDRVGALVLSSGAVTNRIDRVEAAGLVARLPDPDDRRGTLGALTDKGRQVVD